MGDIEKWLAENEVTKCPPGSAEGADDLRYFAKRGAGLRYVSGEDKKSVSTRSLMLKRERRIKRKAQRKQKQDMR